MGKRFSALCLAALSIFLWANASYACVAEMPRPEINISTKEVPIRFDVSRTVNELNKFEIDTVSPYPSHYHTHIGGVMNGRIELLHNIRYGRYESGNERCTAIESVDIELSIKPTIFIAKDYQDQPCWFKQIFEHEAKHVDVDRKIMHEYAERISDGINLAIMIKQDYVTGWAAQKNLKTLERDLGEGVENSLTVLFNQMLQERDERQQAVDTIEEYQRIASACHSS